MKINILIISLYILSIISLCECKKKATKNKIVQENVINNLSQQYQSLQPPVALLYDRNFSTYVIDRPREYFAAVLFTATASKYQCNICLKVKPIFDEVATLYNEQYNFNSSAIDKRIAFFRVEVDNARDIFNDMQLETVPRLYILPPTTKNTPKTKISDFEIENRLFIEGVSSFLQEIERITKIKVVIMMDPMPFLLLLGIVAILLAWFVTAAQGDMISALLWYQSPKVWIFVSAICFGVGVSGSIFCIIRSAPPYGMTKKGLQIFAMQGRDQFLVEGIIVALWTLGCGLSAYLMYLITKLKFPGAWIVRHVGVILFMTTFVILLLEIFQAYRAKTPWYTIKETLPIEIWTWLTQSVKKSTSLSKRLYRVSEIWLLESKDFDSFKKKFKLLVVDYIFKYFYNTTSK